MSAVASQLVLLALIAVTVLVVIPGLTYAISWALMWSAEGPEEHGRPEPPRPNHPERHLPGRS